MQVVLLTLAALQLSLQYSLAAHVSDVVPETRFVSHGAVNEDLRCEDAQPQAPRDLSTGAPGAKRAIGPLNLVPGQADATANGFVHVNTHFHEGAEHKSDAYHSAPHGAAHERRLLSGHAVPGWQCADSVDHEHDNSGMWAPYEFQFCKDVNVGHTYEIHYVHATGGPKNIAHPMSGGLGGALFETRNPSIIVQAQVYVVVNDDSYGVAGSLLDFQHRSDNDVVAYTGSTTGRSFNNEFCSPYEINWHVDRACHRVSAKSFDAMCQSMMENYSAGAAGDLNHTAPAPFCRLNGLRRRPTQCQDMTIQSCKYVRT